jgi:hypothetical protein
LIRRLKHLTTDYGFFCFLTDRDYYEFVQHALETEPYPLEHTYFSDRLFILYTPGEVARYVHDVIVSDAAQDTSALREDELARAVLGMVVAYRSKLNTVDAMRQLSRGWDANGMLVESSGSIVSRFDYRLIVAMQLAVEYLLRQGDLAGPVEQRPEFAQITVDALYYVGREWEEGKHDLTDTDLSFRRYLAKRLRLEAIPEQEDALNAVLEERLDKANLTQLTSINEILCELLADFPLLREVVKLSGILSQEELPLLDVVPHETPGLLRNDPSKVPTEFLFDLYGRDRATGRARRAGQGLSDTELKQIAALDNYSTPLDSVVRDMNGAVSDLFDVGLLPASLVWDVITSARNRVVAAGLNARPYPLIDDDIRALSSFDAIFRASAARLTQVLMLAAQLRHDARVEVPLKVVLERMARVVALPTPRPGEPDSLVARDWPDGAGFVAWSANQWHAAMRRCLDGLPTRPVPMMPELVMQGWQRWQTHVGRFLAGGTALVAPVERNDVLLAVADRAPGSLFRRDLSTMTPFEWTKVVIAGADHASAGGPVWAVVLGLCALRFDKALLTRVTDELAIGLEPGSAEVTAMRAAVDVARSAADGALIVVEDASLYQLPGQDRRPSIVVPQSHLETYAGPLTWLRNQGVYTEVIDEVALDEQDQAP